MCLYVKNVKLKLAVQLKRNTNETCYWCKICFQYLTGFVNISMLLHTKFAAVTNLEKGLFLHAVENWVKFLVLQEGTLGLIFSIKERQNLNHEKYV